MKFYCNKKELNNALNVISHSIPSRTTNKILEGILVEIEDNEMLLTTTDTNISIEAELAIESNEDTSFIIPARLFMNIISKLPKERIMFTYSEHKLNIKSGNSESEIICFVTIDWFLNEKLYVI